jgi:hypothetical protein
VEESNLFGEYFYLFSNLPFMHIVYPGGHKVVSDYARQSASASHSDNPEDMASVLSLMKSSSSDEFSMLGNKPLGGGSSSGTSGFALPPLATDAFPHPPRQVLGKAGDVVLAHYLLPHT